MPLFEIKQSAIEREWDMAVSWVYPYPHSKKKKKKKRRLSALVEIFNVH